MNNYAAKLERGLRMLETQPHLGKSRDEWYQGCRCYSVERHFVLYELVAQEFALREFSISASICRVSYR